VASLSDYEWLIGGDAAAWLDRLARDERSELQQLAAVRRELSTERARLVVEQATVRRRAREKFGALADRMFFTRVLLEQATDLWIANHKSRRLVDAKVAPLVDLCCGLGGDLMAMSKCGIATGWEVSETACLLARANLLAASEHGRSSDSAVQCGDVEHVSLDPSAAWHVDPDRRTTGRRTTSVCRYAPGPEKVDRWRQANPCGAVKLAPAADPPAEWADDAELEWITRDRQCRQQVAWFGPLAADPGKRRATIVGRGDDADGNQPRVLATIVGEPELPCDVADEPGRFVYDPDPSVLAARLLGSLATRHGLRSLGPGGAYLTGDVRVDDPLAAAFIVRDCPPLRPGCSPSTLRRAAWGGSRSRNGAWRWIPTS
jgi:hypothetical protein